MAEGPFPSFYGSENEQITECKPAESPPKACVRLEENRGGCCDPEDKHQDISELCNGISGKKLVLLSHKISF